MSNGSDHKWCAFCRNVAHATKDCPYPHPPDWQATRPMIRRVDMTAIKTPVYDMLQSIFHHGHHKK